MGWASNHIEQLRNGHTVRFRPHGNSMQGKITSGQLCTVEPIGQTPVAVNEIVLCTVKGSQYLHLVKAIRGEQFQIGNNKGGINGWITHRQIYGRCVSVED
jgi:hypothetical protein